MIRLINYGYKKWKVGDIVDLGDKKNESMIAIGRAVAVAAPKKMVEKPKSIKKIEKKKKNTKAVKNQIKNDSNDHRPNEQED